MATRDGDAGTVCAAVSRAHCLGPELRAWAFGERARYRYMGYGLFISY